MDRKEVGDVVSRVCDFNGVFLYFFLGQQRSLYFGVGLFALWLLHV